MLLQKLGWLQRAEKWRRDVNKRIWKTVKSQGKVMEKSGNFGGKMSDSSVIVFNLLTVQHRKLLRILMPNTRPLMTSRYDIQHFKKATGYGAFTSRYYVH